MIPKLLNPKKIPFLLGFLLVQLLLTACTGTDSGPGRNDEPLQATFTRTGQPALTATVIPTSTLTPTVSETPTPTLIPSDTPTPSPSPSPTLTKTPSVTPTYAVLRGRVIPDRANCRYGPGWPYLYKYGLVGGSNLEVIGRIDDGTWVLIQAIGGHNPCWVKADLMEIKGDVFALEPVAIDIIQAWSPYYAPLTGVSARRDGEIVTVFWHPLVLRAGDAADPVSYVVEAWVCLDGQIVFTPVGAYEEVVEITDELGCAEPSRGQVLGAEKHGYTWPVVIPWPPASP